MTSSPSNIRHTFNGKCFIKDVLMQMTVRTGQKWEVADKKAENEQGKRERKKAGAGKPYLVA
jgi:hypothetical protein